MKVRSIRAKKFGPYDDVELKLPEKGLVLISAANGEGKSTLLEAVSFAAFGEWLRGASMQRAEEPGLAEVDVEGGTITRKFGKQKLLSASFLAAEGLTTSKTQTLVEEKIGTFEMWRRSSVFSADDVDRFSAMTDADRKRFLEQVTDPDGKLDSAATRCRDDLRRAEGEAATATRDIAVLVERKKSAEERVELARAAAKRVAPNGDVDQLVRKLATLGEHVRGVTASAEAARDGAHAEQTARERIREDLTSMRATAAADVRGLRQREHLLASGRCDECGQEIGKDAKTEIIQRRAKAVNIEQNAEKRAVILDTQAQKHEDARLGFISALRNFEAERDGYVREQAQLQAEIQRLRAAEGEVASAKEALKTALRALESVEEELGDEEGALDVLKREVLVLGMTATVLGPRGVRGRLLEHVLRAVEVEANEWLDRLRGEHPEMSLKLQPYAEKKGGGLSDVIALKVDYGGGSYASSSRGERRRVDVALTLAASALTTSAGQENGTLFLDEIFDGLDEGGVVAAAKVLRALAAERCVVVISHNRTLVEQLGENVVHYSVASGKLGRVEG